MKLNAKLAAGCVVLLPLSATQVSARALDIFMGLHWCHCNVSAVHLDGNTSLFVPQVWLPRITSSPRFMRAWWQKSEVSPPEGDRWVIWSANLGPEVYAAIREWRDPTQSNDIVLEAEINTISASGQRYVFFCSTAYGTVPFAADQYALVMVAVDASDGQCDYFVQEATNQQGGEMVYGTSAIPGEAPWANMTGWWIGGDITSSSQPVMDTAEALLDLTTKYAHDPFVRGTTAQLFATPAGFARNLDFLSPPIKYIPFTHNCANPNGIIPEMCNRGNANAFPNGPEVAPGLDAYFMAPVGSLTTATSDPCLIPSPAGDGCGGPN